MGTPSLPPQTSNRLHLVSFTCGLLLAIPLAHSISSSRSGLLAFSSCKCDCAHAGRQAAGNGVASAASSHASSSGGSGQYFCPWDHRHSAFQAATKVVDFRRNQSLCMDAVIQGYNIFFEKRRLWRKTKWLGVPMQQNPNDAHIIAEILWKVKPDVLIELGTNTGGGAVYFASIMSLIGKGRVITIDVNDFRDPWMSGNNCPDDDPCLSAHDSHFWKELVTFIQGAATAPEVLKRVRGLLAQWNATTVMVSEDSSHAYTVTLESAHAYAPLVSKGSYLLIQDTKLTRFAKSKACASFSTEAEQDSCWEGLQLGPGDAASTFLAENPDFEVDTSQEFLLFTHHAGGFLKRIR